MSTGYKPVFHWLTQEETIARQKVDGRSQGTEITRIRLQMWRSEEFIDGRNHRGRRHRPMDKKSENVKSQQKKPKSEEDVRESKIEEAFVKAVNKAGGLALKFTSQSMNGVPDRLVLFKIGKCAFVELKAPGKQMRPLQRKRRKQLEVLGFPVFCVDDFDQIEPVIQALKEWNPGEPFPKDVGAEIPEIEEMALPNEEKPEVKEDPDHTEGGDAT